MKDLLTILTHERKTLLKALVIAFLVCFPFTFIPPLLSNGLSLATIIERFNTSSLYALGFALLVVFAAVIHNYNTLVDKKWIFDTPAFKNLEFYGRLDGIGSITRELETFLLGEIGGYFFRLGLHEPENKNPKLEIIPLLDLKEKEAEIKRLKKEHKFQRNHFFGKTLHLNNIDLEDPDSIRTVLEKYADIFRELGLKPLKFDHTKLEED